MSNLTLPLANVYAPVEEDLRTAERILDDELASDLPFINELCETVRSYRGKMVRPALLLLSAKAAGEVVAEHHTLAAVVELVHVSTLVHDDVLDDADERRRRPTIRAMAGNVAAVLLGDYLISRAFHLCNRLSDPYASRRIGAAMNRVCEGELLQNHMRGGTQLDESAYFEIIRRKTASLIATSSELGAYYAEAEDPAVRALHAFGEAAGIAFQIVDDCLDLVGEASTVGKTLGRDLATGKATLPIIHSLAQGDKTITSSLRSILAGRELPDARSLRDWLSTTGSIDYAMNLAEGYVAEACRLLDSLPSSDAKTALTAMAEFIVHRSF